MKTYIVKQELEEASKGKQYIAFQLPSIPKDISVDDVIRLERPDTAVVLVEWADLKKTCGFVYNSVPGTWSNVKVVNHDKLQVSMCAPNHFRTGNMALADLYIDPENGCVSGVKHLFTYRAPSMVNAGQGYHRRYNNVMNMKIYVGEDDEPHLVTQKANLIWFPRAKRYKWKQEEHEKIKKKYDEHNKESTKSGLDERFLKFKGGSAPLTNPAFTKLQMFIDNRIRENRIKADNEIVERREEDKQLLIGIDMDQNDFVDQLEEIKKDERVEDFSISTLKADDGKCRLHLITDELICRDLTSGENYRIGKLIIGIGFDGTLSLKKFSKRRAKYLEEQRLYMVSPNLFCVEKYPTNAYGYRRTGKPKDTEPVVCFGENIDKYAKAVANRKFDVAAKIMLDVITTAREGDVGYSYINHFTKAPKNPRKKSKK